MSTASLCLSLHLHSHEQCPSMSSAGICSHTQCPPLASAVSCPHMPTATLSAPGTCTHTLSDTLWPLQVHTPILPLHLCSLPMDMNSHAHCPSLDSAGPCAPMSTASLWTLQFPELTVHPTLLSSEDTRDTSGVLHDIYTQRIPQHLIRTHAPLCS